MAGVTIVPPHHYRAVVERVIDADTLKVSVDLGFSIWTKQPLRVRGVNAPELRTAQGKAARAAAARLFELRPGVTVQTYKDQQSFARYVADVWLDDGQLFAAWLIEHGYGVAVLEGVR